jgi:hypothetical protein
MSDQNTKKVVIKQPPASAKRPSPRFDKSKFQSSIWNMGYRVIHEKALQCPCKGRGTNHQSSCKNCGGTGWTFINPTSTRAILHSMNLDTKFKEWSKENLGMVNISMEDAEELSYMDRITVRDAEATFNEVVHLEKINNTLFAMFSYNVKEVWYAGLFRDTESKYTQLVKDEDYTVDNHVVYFDDKWIAEFDAAGGDLSVTVRYRHAPQFYVLDLKREVMVTNIVSDDGGESQVAMPISAVGRRGHYVLDAENLSNTRVLDNSFIDYCGNTVKQKDKLW